jgi:hypothetical protein
MGKETASGDYVGGKEGGAGSRWGALTAVMTESLNTLTGRTLTSPDEWFDAVKENRSRLATLFDDKE